MGNQRWSPDFASDALSDGRRFRILAIVDDFSTGRRRTLERAKDELAILLANYAE